MKLETFINQKAQQLIYYVRAYWENRIPYEELELFFWDTMEEWSQVAKRKDEPYSQKERVFWHLLHQLHYWPAQKVQSDPYLKSELQTCIEYLEGEGMYPLDCIGIRP